ncbi:MAG: squalene--hopene cyclase [Planctomycetales bacterium]|nr:squalene--hopene cyclase [Planctomycetales bacterium]
MIRLVVSTVLFSLLISSVLLAETNVSLSSVVAPLDNTADEPLIGAFSKSKATEFLDSASLQWQKQRKCFTCHTNFAYLYARPSLADNPVAHHQVREFAEELVQNRWPEEGPRWDAEVVAAAAALAFNDVATTGKLHAATRTALDRMWTIQQDDGGWDWLKCDWPPMESDDHYGVTLAAIAVGVAPDNYRDTPAAKAGMEKLRNYLAKNPPPTSHHQAMLLWAARYHSDLIDTDQKSATVDRLLKLQQPDGGWAVASLGDWKRADGNEQDTKTSDGYGTGFVLFALRQADVPSTDGAVQRGVQWLKSNQRQSGRWFSRSLYKDNKHFLSHAGSAFAIMALDACDAL